MSNSTLPIDLPVLTDIIDTDGSTVSIPTLTEIISINEESEPTSPLDITEPIAFYPPPEATIEPTVADTAYDFEPPIETKSSLSPDDMQLLIDHFSTHLETVFTEKLDRHLRQLHHQAVHLAIMELKAELPELLNNILHPAEPDN
ncbi:MAG: hypothetical protein ABL873_04260 [Gallionella sp.]|nr:hypothetical protein [Gallionella sp.]